MNTFGLLFFFFFFQNRRQDFCVTLAVLEFSPQTRLVSASEVLGLSAGSLFEIGSCYVVQENLKLKILLPQLPEG